MIEELKKTKASNLWFSMVVVLVVLLNISYAEAKSLRKGEEFKGEHGGAIRVVSSDEVEIEQGPDILLGKYTIDGERVRIVISALGTAMVRYYKIVPDGLKEEKGGAIYYSKAGIVAMRSRAVEEAAKAADAALALEARRFKGSGNGIVTDNDTKLMWQQHDDGRGRKWDDAKRYCSGLALGGHSGWRLPDIEELKSIIVNENRPTANTTYFPNTKPSGYWSSTTDGAGMARAWGVDFRIGAVGGYYDKPDGGAYARCVRGGADVNIKSNSVQNIDLLSAVEKGNTDIVKELLDKGADVNAKNINGNTALIFAVEKKNAEIIKMLLDKGGDVNAKDISTGVTVLMFAVYDGNTELVKMLLAKGADVNAKDKDGTPVLFTAVYYGNTELVKMLLEKGADVSIKDNEGKTAFDNTKDPKIQEMLNQYAAQKKK